MVEMRLPFLLMLVPALALADASTPPPPPPPKAGPAPAAPTTIEYTQSADGTQTQATAYAPGTSLFTVDGGRPVRVLDRRDRDYLVEDRGQRRTVAFVELTPFAFAIDGRTVTVGFGADFKIHVRVQGGGDLALAAAGQGYLSQKGGNLTAALVAHAAPVPLVEVGSHPEACADFWDIYVSAVAGVPRQALALYGVADPPAMQESTAKFDARAGSAVVTTRTTADEGAPTRTKRTRYRFDGSVYVEVSKRPAGGSK
jgi:hypothetical protein